MKKRWITAALATGLTAAAVFPAGASDTWNMAYIGKMKVPEHVTFYEGEQQALPFMKSGGIRWTLTREGILDGVFYTMTYADGPDFSYGWASSHVIGLQYLLKQGETAYRNKSPAEQMDVIAKHLIQEIKEKGAVYEGNSPLVRKNDRSHPRWEGSFVITTEENGVVYKEAYHMILQVSGFRVVLGIINSDAEHRELTAALSKMAEKRSFFKDKDILEEFLKKG